MCDVIRDVCSSYSPFDLEFTGTGGFPETDRPRVLYAGVQDESGSLCRLVGQLETQLAGMGFKREPRDYRPHLTLGRTRSGSRRATADVVARLKAQDNARLGSMVVDTLQVFASFLDKGGPTYQVMDTVQLG